MRTLELHQNPVMQTLGWTLLHFLWQGAVVALLLALTLSLLRHRTPQARYLASSLALFLMCLCPVVTFQQLLPGPEPRAAFLLPSVGSSVPDALPTTASLTTRLLSPESPALPSLAHSLPWVVSVWFVGVCLLSLRALGGWITIQRLAKRSVYPITDSLLARMEEMRQQLGIRQSVRLRVSSIVRVPTMFGCLRSVILLPVGVLAGLSPGQVEALLAHELAHIRRHDYLVNLFQVFMEITLFYHPAVWWVSQRMRVEREHCCDDMAVALLGNRRVYVHALASLEQLCAAPPALAASDGDLLTRIRHLLGEPTMKNTLAPAWLAGSLTLTLFLATAAAALHLQAQKTPSKPSPVAKISPKNPASAPAPIQSEAHPEKPSPHAKPQAVSPKNHPAPHSNVEHTAHDQPLNAQQTQLRNKLNQHRANKTKLHHTMAQYQEKIQEIEALEAYAKAHPAPHSKAAPKLKEMQQKLPLYRGMLQNLYQKSKTLQKDEQHLLVYQRALYGLHSEAHAQPHNKANSESSALHNFYYRPANEAHPNFYNPHSTSQHTTEALHLRYRLSSQILEQLKIEQKDPGAIPGIKALTEDARTNSLIIQGTPEAIKALKARVEQLDTRAEQPGIAETGVVLGMRLLRFKFEEDGSWDVETVSQPTLITPDRQEAQIEVQDAGAGFRIAMTPRINPDGTVTVQGELKVSARDNTGLKAYPGKFRLQVESTRAGGKLTLSPRITLTGVTDARSKDIQKMVEKGRLPLPANAGANVLYYLQLTRMEVRGASPAPVQP
jgi:beta-lactamase regulating signal transducer with metallopeptidase domain